MSKKGLLIGVSQYKSGLPPLPAASRDVEAMKEILMHPQIGAFDEVVALTNPTLMEMRRAISGLFDVCGDQDLILFYFSGHGLVDEFGDFFFTNCETEKTGQLDKATWLEANYVHRLMENCRCKRQVVILDCCQSGAFPSGLVIRNDGFINFQQILGGEGRVILTSSAATQYSFELQGQDLAVYTHHLIEGMKTGLADLNKDGWIDVDELHIYVKQKVEQTTRNSMQPQRFVFKDGEKILLAKAETQQKDDVQKTSSQELSSVSVSLFDSPSNIFKFDVVTVNEIGKEVARSRQSAREFIEDLGNGIRLELVLIPGGSFRMGASKTESDSPYERPSHIVKVPSFLMAKYPITQEQWELVSALPRVDCALNPSPSLFGGRKLPVESITWFEAVEFCKRLSVKTGRSYRLPSEAEWEYGCRGGTTSPFHFGKTITTNIANYRGKDWWYEGAIRPGNYSKGPKGIHRERTTEVGDFAVANAYGLFDMHGNVFEWCADHWHSSYNGAPLDASPWLSQSDTLERVIRGGCWNNTPWHCRSAFRSKLSGDQPMITFGSIGFRVAINFDVE